MTAFRDPGSALVVPQFRLFLAGNSVTSLGTWVQNLAAAVLVYRLTGSTLLVGVLNFSMFIGTLLLAPVVGTAADRFDRRRMLSVTQVAAAAVTGAMAAAVLTGRESTLLVIGLSALLGITHAFFVPVMLAMVPQLVDEDRLENALAINSGVFNLSRSVGPVLAAVVVTRWGVGWAFTLNAASFAAYGLILLRLRPTPQDRDPQRRPGLRDCLTLVREAPQTLPLLVAVATLSLVSEPVVTLTPEYATQLGGSDTQAGLLIGAFGGGAALVALTLSARMKNRRNVLPGGMVLLGMGVAGFGLAPAMSIACVALFIGGAGYIVAVSRALARLQMATPDHGQGRLMAMFSLAYFGARPVASLAAGALADTIGVRAAAVALAVPAFVTACWLVSRVRPRLVAKGVLPTIGPVSAPPHWPAISGPTNAGPVVWTLFRGGGSLGGSRLSETDRGSKP